MARLPLSSRASPRLANGVDEALTGYRVVVWDTIGLLAARRRSSTAPRWRSAASSAFVRARAWLRIRLTSS
jgi:hypothetical protein